MSGPHAEDCPACGRRPNQRLREWRASQPALNVQRLARTLRDGGFVVGVAQRYGRFNDVYYEQQAERLLARLDEDSSPLGHGTPVPEEATLPSGDARVAGL